MIQRSVLFVSLIICIGILLPINNCNAQINRTGIAKKYTIKDTTDEKHAELILYQNGTFLNFGLVNNKKEKDWYIWFTSGVYLSSSDKLLLKSSPDSYENDQKTLKNIKDYYIWHHDHAFISNYYEYIKESLKDYPLIYSSNLLVDTEKQIEYVEYRQ